MAFVKFYYEGQETVARLTGRDFFIENKSGNLPALTPGW